MLRLLAVLLVSCLVVASSAHEKSEPEAGTLAHAKMAGWNVVNLVAEMVGDEKNYQSRDNPGNLAWFAELRKATEGCDPKKPVSQWPNIDSDALVTRNPCYWQMHFEVSPGDPSLALMHAGLMQMAGYTERSSYVLVIAAQAPGIPDEIRKLMLSMVRENNQSLVQPQKLLHEGIELHDKGNYDGAVAKYDAALKLHPRYGAPNYERGYSIRTKAWNAAGVPESKQKVAVNDKSLPESPREVTESFTTCRRNDPLYYMAYQGRDQEVIAGLMALTQKGLPAWKKMTQAFGPGKLVEDEVLREFADAMQAAGVHDLALLARQVLVIRRVGYASQDYPFLEKSLKALAKGEPIDKTLALLNGKDPLRLRQFTKFDAVRKEAKPEGKKVKDDVQPKVADVDHILLLIPTPELPDRVGDVEPLANYLKVVWRKVDEVMSTTKADEVKAKGLMVIVGIKSKSKVRIWCESIDGVIPAELLRKIEKEVGQLEAIDVKKAPVAFALNMKLFGRQPGKFEKVPVTWAEAAKKHGVDVVIPPDDLFKHIWKD